MSGMMVGTIIKKTVVTLVHIAATICFATFIIETMGLEWIETIYLDDEKNTKR